MNKLKNIENCLDAFDGEIERIRAFAEYLAITEDYKMETSLSDNPITIDCSAISKDLFEYVEKAHDKWLELKNELDNISITDNDNE